MASALFDINDDGEDRGYEATNSEVLTLALRADPPLGVNTVVWQVFDPAGFDPALGIAGNPPRASKDAPTLTIVGATSGQAVSPASVDGSVSITMPGSGSHSWIVRCIVNGGVRVLPNGQAVADPSLIHERGVWLPTLGGNRKVVCTELQQFEVDGWAGALAEFTLDGEDVGNIIRRDGVQLMDLTPGGGSGSGGEYIAADFNLANTLQLIFRISGGGIVQIAGLPSAPGLELPIQIEDGLASSEEVHFLNASTAEPTTANRLSLPDSPLKLTSHSAAIKFHSYNSRWRVESAVVPGAQAGAVIRFARVQDFSLTGGDGSGANGEFVASDFAALREITSTIRIDVTDDGAVELAGLPSSPGRPLSIVKLGSSGIVAVVPSSGEEPTAANRFLTGLAERVELRDDGDNLRILDEVAGHRVCSVAAASVRRPTLRRVHLVDEFCSALGDLNWTLSGVGTPTAAKSASSTGESVGTSRFSTSGAANDTAAIAGADCYFSRVKRLGWLVDVSAITDTLFELGIGVDPTASALGTDSIYFAFNTAIGPNWLCATRASSTGTVTDTGIPAVAGQQIQLELRRRGNVVFFFFNGALVAQHTTNIPASPPQALFGARIQALAASSRNFRADRFDATIELGARFE